MMLSAPLHLSHFATAALRMDAAFELGANHCHGVAAAQIQLIGEVDLTSLTACGTAGVPSTIDASEIGVCSVSRVGVEACLKASDVIRLSVVITASMTTASVGCEAKTLPPSLN